MLKSEMMSLGGSPPGRSHSRVLAGPLSRRPSVPHPLSNSIPCPWAPGGSRAGIVVLLEQMWDSRRVQVNGLITPGPQPLHGAVAEGSLVDPPWKGSPHPHQPEWLKQKMEKKSEERKEREARK